MDRSWVISNSPLHHHSRLSRHGSVAHSRVSSVGRLSAEKQSLHSPKLQRSDGAITNRGSADRQSSCNRSHHRGSILDREGRGIQRQRSAPGLFGDQKNKPGNGSPRKGSSRDLKFGNIGDANCETFLYPNDLASIDSNFRPKLAEYDDQSGRNKSFLYPDDWGSRVLNSGDSDFSYKDEDNSANECSRPHSLSALSERRRQANSDKSGRRSTSAVARHSRRRYSSHDIKAHGLSHQIEHENQPENMSRGGSRDLTSRHLDDGNRIILVCPDDLVGQPLQPSDSYSGQKLAELLGRSLDSAHEDLPILQCCRPQNLGSLSDADKIDAKKAGEKAVSEERTNVSSLSRQRSNSSSPRFRLGETNEHLSPSHVSDRQRLKRTEDRRPQTGRKGRQRVPCENDGQNNYYPDWKFDTNQNKSPGGDRRIDQNNRRVNTLLSNTSTTSFSCCSEDDTIYSEDLSFLTGNKTDNKKYLSPNEGPMSSSDESSCSGYHRFAAGNQMDSCKNVKQTTAKHPQKSIAGLMELNKINCSYPGWSDDYNKAETALQKGNALLLERLLQSMKKRQSVHNGDRSHPRLIQLDALSLSYPRFDSDLRKLEELHFVLLESESGRFWEKLDAMKSKEQAYINFVGLDTVQVDPGQDKPKEVRNIRLDILQVNQAQDKLIEIKNIHSDTLQVNEAHEKLMQVKNIHFDKVQVNQAQDKLVEIVKKFSKPALC